MSHRVSRNRSRSIAARLETASLLETSLAFVIAMSLSWLIFAV